MNVQQLRESLKRRWLTYYRDNRDWLVHLAIWVDDDGQRRPSSSFILGTLSVLEPRLTQLLPLIVGLNNNPDRIITVLGLNIGPDEALKELEASQPTETKMLPAQRSATAMPDAMPSSSVAALEGNSAELSSKAAARQDEDCGGRHGGNPRDR